MKLIYYDLETTGLSPQHDMVMEIQAVETDGNSIPTGERFYTRVRLGIDRLPSPEVLLLSGRSIQEFMSADAPNRINALQDFYVWSLHRAAADPDTIFLGWNSRHFDDDFVRNELFRAMVWPNGPEPKDVWAPRRHDLMRIAQMAHWVYGDTALKVPLKHPKRGQPFPSFRLEGVSQSNGIAHPGAHTAAGDVDATVEVGKLLRQTVPAELDRQLQFGDPAVGQQWLRDHPYFVALDVTFGRFSAIAATLLNDNPTEQLLLLGNVTVPMPEQGRINDKNLPVRYFSTHAPMVLPYDAPGKEFAQAKEAAGLPSEWTVKDRAAALDQDRSFRQFLEYAWKGRQGRRNKNVTAPRHVGGKLRIMRLTDDVRASLERFRNWGVDGLTSLADPQITRLAARAVLEMLSEPGDNMARAPRTAELQTAMAEVQAELLAEPDEGDGTVGPLSIPTVLAKVQKLLTENPSDDDRTILEGYGAWLRERRERVATGVLAL